MYRRCQASESAERAGRRLRARTVWLRVADSNCSRSSVLKYISSMLLVWLVNASKEAPTLFLVRKVREEFYDTRIIPIQVILKIFNGPVPASPERLPRAMSGR